MSEPHVRPVLRRKPVPKHLQPEKPKHVPGPWLLKRRKQQELERQQQAALAYEQRKAKRHGQQRDSIYRMPKGSYAAMLERQNHSCVTCNRHESDLTRRLAVDHCHQTGKVRGLLCASCNRILGMVRENPQTLRHLAVYLEYHASRE